MDVSVVIPLFNERDNLGPLHGELDGVLGAMNCSYELLFIDDGSTDGGEEVLRSLKQRDEHVRVIGRERSTRQTAAQA